MAESERLGASFSIDITALKTGLAQANRLIRESNSEFKAAAAGLDDWTSSEEGLTAKLKNLNDVAGIQAKKVEALQKEYDRCIADGLDPMSAAAVKMRTDLNNEKAAFEKTKSEAEKYKKKLEETSNAADDAADRVEETGKAAKESGDGFTVAKGAIANFIGSGLTALAGAAKNAISSIANLAGETREFRQDMATLETAFASAGFSAETATDTWTDLYAVFGEDDRAVEAANNISRMSKNQEDLNKWVTITKGIWGTYQDALPVEALAESAGETAKVGKVTGNLADALNWSSEAASMFSKYMSEDVTSAEDAFNVALSECTNEQERQALVTETLTALYGDAAAKYDETSASTQEANRASAEYQQTMADLGDKIEPITANVKEGFAKILEKVLELVEGVDFDAFGEKISDAFEKFINETLPKIIDGLQWIRDHKDEIIAGIAGIGTAFLAFKVVSLIQGVISALQGMTLAQAALNLVMSMNPIGLVIAAVAGLVAAFIVLWNKCDGFRNFFVGMWEGIKTAFNATVEWLGNACGKIGDFFSNLWKGIKKGCVLALNGIIGYINFWIKGLNKLLTPFRAIIYGVAKAFGSSIKLSDVKIPTIPKIAMAQGGVVSKATTALIGEDGAEAVVPLERNTEWIDKVADKIASKQKAVVVNQTNNYSRTHSRYEIYTSQRQTERAVRRALGGA